MIARFRTLALLTSAVSWMLFAIILVVTMVYWKFGNRETSY